MNFYLELSLSKLPDCQMIEHNGELGAFLTIKNNFLIINKKKGGCVLRLLITEKTSNFTAPGTHIVKPFISNKEMLQYDIDARQMKLVGYMSPQKFAAKVVNTGNKDFDFLNDK